MNDNVIRCVDRFVRLLSPNLVVVEKSSRERFLSLLLLRFLPFVTRSGRTGLTAS